MTHVLQLRPVLVLLFTAVLAGCAEPSASTQSEPTSPTPMGPVLPLTLTDGTGDAGSFPCSAASDLREVSLAWGLDGVHFNYTFSDLSILTGPAGLAQSMRGSCFWSYTDFVAEIGNETLMDSVYMDHNANPAYTTGWRFYLHELRLDLEATVSGNDIHVLVPYSLLGQPTIGDRIGDIRFQASNSWLGAGVDYQTDWYPDDSNACDCWLNYNTV